VTADRCPWAAVSGNSKFKTHRPKAGNSKFKIPNKFKITAGGAAEIQNSKSQIPNNFKIPTSKRMFFCARSAHDSTTAQGHEVTKPG